MTAQTAYVPGVFDMFHIGHLNILRAARGIADRVVAGVVTDETCKAMKGVNPVIPFHERAEIVGSIGIVDEVFADFSECKLDAWKMVGFDAIVKGDDWRGTPKGERLELQMESVGVKVFYFPYTEDCSSSSLRLVLGDGGGSGAVRSRWEAALDEEVLG